MKILFFGSSSFSLPVLAALLDSPHEVCGIVTTPPKPKGRGLKLEPNPVQAVAQSMEVPCLAPEKLRPPEVLGAVAAFPCDVLVVASYGKILPGPFLKVPRLMPLNIHPSLLPKYRGAAPINWQILSGEKETGVTVFQMEEGLDSGAIIAQSRSPLAPEEDAVALAERLSREGARLLLEVLRQIEAGTAALKPQDPTGVTYAPKLQKEDGVIHWEKSAAGLADQVRGLLPWPTAYTYWDKKPLQVLKARAGDTGCTEAKPGEILEVSRSGFIRVQTGKGSLLIERVKPAGKRDMYALEFANGYRLKPGQSL